MRWNVIAKNNPIFIGLLGGLLTACLLDEKECKMLDCSKEIRKFHDEEVTLQSAQQNEMRERRNSNRDRLKSGLKNNGKPSPIYLRSQGSYAMRTMVQDAENDYDIDDGMYFKQEDLKTSQGNDMSALSVRNMICDIIQDERFNNKPEVKNNCVRVYYNDGSHIDVPAYRIIIEKDFLGNETENFELASSDWKASDPRKVTDWLRDTAKDKSPDDDPDQFRRIVRLLKAFSKSRSGWKTDKGASGFTITKLTQEVFVAASGRDDESLHKTMKAIKQRLDLNLSVYHPVIHGEKLAKNDDVRTRRFKERLEQNLEHLNVMDNPECTPEQALKAWGKVFNNTDFFDARIQERKSANNAIGSMAIIKEAERLNLNSPVNKQGNNEYA
ncbi:MAG: cyclic GMP-AMP synthase DncV-like nucleotidyltransferase [Alphaproteobacteria bacterium]